jgi:hypothetical protein
VLPKASTGPHTASQPQIEVPFTDYKVEKNHPYTVDHYELGQYWDDAEGGYNEEVSIIENYLISQVEKGEIENSLSAVNNRLKEIEKITNVSKNTRKILRVSTVAAYMKFLLDTEEVKNHLRKYGGH